MAIFINHALTPKQNAFAVQYVATGNASEAYRRAYNATNMKRDTIHSRASELLKHGGIAAREMGWSSTQWNEEEPRDTLCRLLRACAGRCQSGCSAEAHSGGGDGVE